MDSVLQPSPPLDEKVSRTVKLRSSMLLGLLTSAACYFILVADWKGDMWSGNPAGIPLGRALIMPAIIFLPASAIWFFLLSIIKKRKRFSIAVWALATLIVVIGFVWGMFASCGWGTCPQVGIK